MTVDSDLGAVVDKEEWAVMSIFWERRKNRPSMGERQRRCALFFCRVRLALRRMDPED